MKRLFIILLVVSLVSSCKKDDSPSDSDFVVSGIEKVVTRVEETHTLRLLITSNGTYADNVYLMLDNVPAGITCTIDNSLGVPDFAANIVIRVSREAPGGNHPIKLICSSGAKVKQYVINVDVDKSLSAVFTVYNSLTYDPEKMSSNLVDSALVELYKDHSTFLSGIADYKVYTDKKGKAMFFKIPVGTYLFTVKKENLSNIIQKRSVDGIVKGYIVAGIFRTNQEIINSAQPKAKIGDLKFRDVNADNKIDSQDLGQYDNLSIYDGDINEKVIWLGQ